MRAPSRFLGLLLTLPLLMAGTPIVAADHAYHQPVWFTWDTTELDVLVLGVEDPIIGAGIRDAVQAWRVGIAALGGPQLQEVQLRLYIAGLDPLPPEGFQPDDVEIFIASPGTFAANACLVMDICSDSPVCSAHAPLYPDDAYRVASHELGHCLGLAHVFDHRYEYHPRHDVMGLGETVTGERACPSNLNVMTLERVFGGLIGLPSGGEAQVASAAYAQAACLESAAR